MISCGNLVAINSMNETIQNHHRRITSSESTVNATIPHSDSTASKHLHFWFTSIGGAQDLRFQYTAYLQAALESGLQNAKSLQPVVLFTG